YVMRTMASLRVASALLYRSFFKYCVLSDCYFLVNDTATPEIYTLSLHDALPICASLNIRHNLSSSKGPKPLQLKLLTTYIPKTSAFTLAFSTSQRLRTTRASARTFFTFRHYITPSARNF